MNNIIKAIVWLKNRCCFRYKEPMASQTINFLLMLENTFNKIENCNIPQEDLDKIITKYYFDFTFDKINDPSYGSSMGFDERDRQVLRHNISNIYKDIVQYFIQSSHSDSSIPHDLTHQFDNEEEILNIIGSHMSA